MSLVDQYAMHLNEFGLSSIPDKLVCADHFNEEPFKNVINEKGKIKRCSYCSKKRKVLSLEELMFRIMKTVRFFYTDPANFMPYDSSEGGYHDQSNIYDATEVIFEHLELDVSSNDLQADIEDSVDISAAWSDENKYGDDPADYLLFEWEEFKEIIKHKARYLFFDAVQQSSYSKGNARKNAYGILNALGEKVLKYNFLQTLSTNTPLFRCRQHKPTEPISQKEELCAPEIKHVIYPNRMSPSGISMFYAASELKTAELETIDLHSKEKSCCTSGIFMTKSDLNVIDFSILPDLVDKWDADRLEDYYPIRFMHSFVKDITKPVKKDGYEHIEYVPTQVITEYFRYSFVAIHKLKKNIDGIIFPSSKNRNKRSIVLFMDHEQSLQRLAFLDGSIKTKIIF
jgi:RES domain-containing protein